MGVGDSVDEVAHNSSSQRPRLQAHPHNICGALDTARSACNAAPHVAGRLPQQRSAHPPLISQMLAGTAKKCQLGA